MDKSFKELPKIHTTYANIIKSLLPRGDKNIKDLPNTTYHVEHLNIDKNNLAEYCAVCGFANNGHVPATYFAVLSQTLQMNMMASDEFPFAMLGLIHLANSVTQYRPILATENLQLSVQIGNLQAHNKGQQFDFATSITDGNGVVWKGISTYLSRQKTQKTSTPPTHNVTKSARLAITPHGIQTCIDVPEDIGRRYAFVSGDFNLIHLHPLSARAFGFPKAIAHGMWTKAITFAQLIQSINLPPAFDLSVQFNSPIFLPSTVELVAICANNDIPYSDWHFALYGKNDKVHMTGELIMV